MPSRYIECAPFYRACPPCTPTDSNVCSAHALRSLPTDPLCRMRRETETPRRDSTALKIVVVLIFALAGAGTLAGCAAHRHPPSAPQLLVRTGLQVARAKHQAIVLATALQSLDDAMAGQFVSVIRSRARAMEQSAMTLRRTDRRLIAALHSTGRRTRNTFVSAYINRSIWSAQWQAWEAQTLYHLARIVHSDPLLLQGSDAQTAEQLDARARYRAAMSVHSSSRALQLLHDHPSAFHYVPVK